MKHLKNTFKFSFFSVLTVTFFFFSLSVLGISDNTSVKDRLNEKYNEVSQLSIPELSKEKVGFLKSVWQLSEALELLSHIGLQLNETDEQLLNEFLDMDEDSTKSVLPILSLLEERLDEYISLQGLRNVVVSNRFVLVRNKLSSTLTFKLENIDETLLIRGAKFQGTDCSRLELDSFKCDVATTIQG